VLFRSGLPGRPASTRSRGGAPSWARRPADPARTSIPFVQSCERLLRVRSPDLRASAAPRGLQASPVLPAGAVAREPNMGGYPAPGRGGPPLVAAGLTPPVRRSILAAYDQPEMTPCWCI